MWRRDTWFSIAFPCEFGFPPTLQWLNKVIKMSSKLYILNWIEDRSILWMSSYHNSSQDKSSNMNNIVAMTSVWVKWRLAYSDWILCVIRGHLKDQPHGNCIWPSPRSFYFSLSPSSIIKLIKRDYNNWIEC